jgi:hypothetical protein
MGRVLDFEGTAEVLLWHVNEGDGAHGVPEAV